MSQDITHEYDEVLRRLLEDAGSVADRWTQLAGVMDHLPASRLEQALSALAAVGVEGWTDVEKKEVWTKLRDTASRHLRFPDSAWAMPQESARAILESAERFAPDNLALRISDLFAPNVELPDGSGMDWRAHEAAVANARAAAVHEIWEHAGLPGLVDLAHQVDAPWTLGMAAADEEVFADIQPPIQTFLEQNDGAATDVVRALLVRTVDKGRSEDVAALLTDPRSASWSPDWRALVYTALDFSPSVWESIDQEGGEVKNRYWHMVSYHGRGPLEPEMVALIAAHFVEVGNLLSALGLVALYSREASPSLIVSLLKEATSVESAGNIPWERLGADLLILVSVLQESDGVDQDDVAMLEWQLVPFVMGSPHEARALQRKLSRDPEFFIEVLSLAYRAEGEKLDPNPSDQTRARASRAAELLWDWHTPPGSTPGGEMEGDALVAWVNRARTLASECGRLAIADLQIGEALAYAPIGSDGVWPAEAVRDLIESLQSEEIDRGFAIGKANSRGVTTRALGDGGDQERSLSAQFESNAVALRDRWPRTSAVLTRIAQGYVRDARRLDSEAALEVREIQMPSASEPG